MTPDIEIYADAEGRVRARAAPDLALLASYLEEDVQDNLVVIDDVLDAIRSATEGRVAEDVFSGNAHTLIVRPTGVIIDNHFLDDPPLVLSSDDFTKYLEGWRSAIHRSPRDPPRW